MDHQSSALSAPPSDDGRGATRLPGCDASDAAVDSPSENYLVIEHLQDMPSLFARGLVYIIVLLLAAGILYSCMATIDVVVESQAIARPQCHKVRVLSDRNGYIQEVYVAEGQAVERGAPLYSIRAKSTVALTAKVEELRTAIPLRTKYYDLKIEGAIDDIRRRTTRHAATLKVLSIERQKDEMSLAAAGSELAFWNAEVEHLAKELQRWTELHQQGFASETRYETAKLQLERARTEARKCLSRRDIAQKEKAVTEARIANEKASYAQDKAALEREVRNLELEKLTALQAMRSELDMNERMLSFGGCTAPCAAKGADAGEDGNILRAGRAGVISELCFRNRGDYVRESDLLCTIVPADSPLYMDITVANKDVGLIESGMDIEYKVEAFPYADHGTLPGKVLAISPSAVRDGRQGFVYHLRGSLERPYFEIKGKRYPIKAGMTATAELITERRSIAALLVRKLSD